MAEVTPFGRLSDGRPVRAVDLAAGGLRARVLDFGARLILFSRDGGPNACAGVETLADCETDAPYSGPLIAPVINRIGGARATVDGTLHRFEANQDGRHTLHSGRAGTQGAVWTLADSAPDAAVFEIALADGEGGFPGNRRIRAAYRVEPPSALVLRIEATTDAPTLMNPALHGVFRAGPGGPKTQRLELPADRYLPANADVLPTGEIAPVAGTRFDFRTPRRPPATLDHNFCYGAGFGLRARLAGDGTVLEIHSDAPGLQVYTGGAHGIALEPQMWPDAPNHAEFPPIDLAPGDVFRQRTEFRIV